jgi:hypothetical protein
MEAISLIFHYQKIKLRASIYMGGPRLEIYFLTDPGKLFLGEMKASLSPTLSGRDALDG